MMDGWDADTGTANPAIDLGVSAGDIFYLGDAEIGYFAAASYSNSWSQREQGFAGRTAAGQTSLRMTLDSRPPRTTLKQAVLCPSGWVSATVRLNGITLYPE